MAEKITNPAIEKEQKALAKLAAAVNSYRLQEEAVKESLIELKTEIVSIQKEIESTKKAQKAAQANQKKHEEISAQAVKKGMESTDLLRKTMEDIDEARKVFRSVQNITIAEEKDFVVYKKAIEKAKIVMLLGFEKQTEKIKSLMQ